MAQVNKRGDSYQLIANLGYDAHGVKVRKTKTWKPKEGMNPEKAKKKAYDEALRFEDSFKKGEAVATKVSKFEAYAEDWLKNIAPLRQNEGSLANSSIYAKRAYKKFGHKRMDWITTEDIQDYITELRTEERSDKHTNKRGERSAKTVRSYVGFVSSVFNHAVKMGKVIKNPCQGAELPKIEETEQEIYSEEETNRILEFLHLHEHEKHLDFVLYFTLMIYTGFSRQELLGLEYKDFDFKRSIVTLKRGSKYMAGKGIYTGALKNKYRYRTIGLPLVFMDFILNYKARQAEYIEKLGDKWVEQIKGLNDELVGNDRLFTTDFGLPMTTNAPENFFRRFCKKYSLPYINPHGIRHTNASINIFAGVDVKTLQMLLGHSTPITTLKTYTKVFNAAQAAQAVAMERFTGVIPFPVAVKNGFLEAGHQTDIKTPKSP
jgi:integrase